MSRFFNMLRLSRRSFVVCLSGALLLAGLSGCSTQQVESKSADVKRSGSARSNVATPDRLSYAALERLRHRVVYDGRYIPIGYPNGDVPANTGVCTDTVIRSYRKLGVDLQRLVYEDMSNNFYSYPNLAKWGLNKPDPNIDHRRVHNLKAFFTRHGGRVPVTGNAADYRPGDLVTWSLGGDQEHIGIVVNRKSSAGRPLIVHNIGEGERIEDVLFAMPISGHYRYFPGGGGATYASAR